jgi:hypothetical protein
MLPDPGGSIAVVLAIPDRSGAVAHKSRQMKPGKPITLVRTPQETRLAIGMAGGGDWGTGTGASHCQPLLSW